jgi:hypothetical protein
MEAEMLLLEILIESKKTTWMLQIKWFLVPKIRR